MGFTIHGNGSIAYPIDYMKKIAKAIEIKGPTYINVHCPCPPSWSFDENLTVKIARLVVQTGMWPLYEIENGEFRLTFKVAERKPITEYLQLQQGFGHLIDNKQEIAKLQEWLNQLWASIK